jgi:mannose-6-phosphate isomerase-like protein (cupin superfamily)
MVRTVMMTARPPTIPRMLKVAPTAALFLKKPEETAAPVAVASMVRVEPVVVGREPANPDVGVFGVLTNVVVGLLALLDTAPTDELVTRGEEDTWVFEEGEGEGEGEDDDVEVGVGGAEVVPGEVDVAGDGEGEEEKLCGAGGD